MRVFALTFAYNEVFFLPRWVAYYGAQLGLENLYVLDHGSSDLSTQGLGPVNIIRVPRTVYDEVQRITFATHMFAALLQYYEAGFVVDVDEFLVAEPTRFRTLREFAAATRADALASIGLELFHVRSLEPEFRESLPVLMQRRHVLFDSWMCKRSFARKPLRIGGGLHTSDQPVEFDDDLFLIHLKNFDYHHRFMRQRVTASWDYAGDFGVHARKSVEYVDAIFQGIDARVAAGKVSREFDFRRETAQCLERAVLNPSGEYDFNLQGGFQSEALHVLPPQFEGLF